MKIVEIDIPATAEERAALLLESPRLQSLTEAHRPNYCNGLPGEKYCGDEIPKDAKFCASCQGVADKQEHAAALVKQDEADRRDQSQYGHLEMERRDREEEARLQAIVALTKHITVDGETKRRCA